VWPLTLNVPIAEKKKVRRLPVVPVGKKAGRAPSIRAQIMSLYAI
jgi:hypothetical protein